MSLDNNNMQLGLIQSWLLGTNNKHNNNNNNNVDNNDEYDDWKIPRFYKSHNMLF